MALSVGESGLLVLLLASVLQQAELQSPKTICSIEVDSTSGLWRDVTPTDSTNHDPRCASYSYRETSLTCTSQHCQSGRILDEDCTLYYNADTAWQCLATCNSACTHGSQCPKGQALCPCQRDSPRYNYNRMCVPYTKLKDCSQIGQIYENGQCTQSSCSDTCPNGLCDRQGICSCLKGFKQDKKTGKCVPKQCLDACVEGTCHVYGDCTCKDGAVARASDGFQCNTNNTNSNPGLRGPVSGGTRDQNLCKSVTCTNGQCDQQSGKCKCYAGYKMVPKNELVCSQIVCPNEEQFQYCKLECEQNGCTRTNGSCDTGTCICNQGFKKDPGNTNKCNKINCPSSSSSSSSREDSDYCKSQCQLQCNNGWCSDGGICSCYTGFKKDPNTKDGCKKINCPPSSSSSSSSSREDSDYCKSQCQLQCNNGWCSDGGICSCNEGFKKDPNTKSGCKKINCPSASIEDDVYCKSQCDTRCINGGCSNGGFCICNNGFKKDPNTKDSNTQYTCNKINCPSASREDYVYCKSLCQPQCNNGECDFKGKCRCNEGFKKEPKNNKYKCVNINCPDWGHTEYCQDQCPSLGCTQGDSGQCVDGECRCNWGFKKDPNNEYKCNKINCPSASREDYVYCKSQCQPQCNNGRCDFKGECICNPDFKRDPGNTNKCFKIICPDKDHTEYCQGQCPLVLGCTQGGSGQCVDGKCRCNEGFKKDPKNEYKCVQINCPSASRENYVYCKSQCDTHCINGRCSNEGFCSCNTGFTNYPKDHYKCMHIKCPSSLLRNVTEQTFCKSVCEAQCTNGACDDFGACQCKERFKRRPSEIYKCYKIRCPARESEDYPYCASQCNITCNNGECDEEGVCKCFEDFVSTNRTKVDCYHKCNLDGTCPLAAILSGIVGVGLAICVVIIVTAAILIRARNRREQAEKEQGEVQEIPLETLSDEPEYTNYQQEAEMEENTLYMSFENQCQPSRRVVK